MAVAAQTPRETATLLRSTSTIVTVPAVVRGPSGEFVTNLSADDFFLFDNGSLQLLKLARDDDEPIALVVVVQTGGAAVRHFFDLSDLPALLDWITAGTGHELMLVSFDSHVEMTWHFPVRSDGVAYALTHLHAGDQGAAIVDAVQFAVEQLQSEPGNFRRIVLLISQQNDDGSKGISQDALRTLGKSSTAIYSLSFAAPAKRKTASARGKNRSDTSSPLAAALDALDHHTTTELSAYTGGAEFSVSTQQDFSQAIRSVAADIRNRYALSFQPSAQEPGFHELTIRSRPGLKVTARGGYWFDPVHTAR